MWQKSFVYRVFAPILAYEKCLEFSPNRLKCTLLSTVIIAKYTYRYTFDDEARPVISWYLYLYFPLFLSLYPLFPLML